MSQYQLADYLEGQLSEEAQAVADAHIEHCVCCQAELDRLSSDSTDDGWLSATPTPPPDESVVEFLDRLKAQVPSFDGSVGDPSEETTAFELPGPYTADAPLGRLGNFRVIDKLSEGTFGTVYRAYNERLERIVAIKVLKPHWASSQVHREQFFRDARAAGQVDHDHVVTVHEADEIGEVAYYAMEYVSGGTLGERLKAPIGLEAYDAAIVTRQIALAAHALHTVEKSAQTEGGREVPGFIHRDIKPSNVLFDPTTNRYKLADFGLARTLTDTGMGGAYDRAGTPAYMSPEQVRANGPIDARSDVYSIGVVLFQLLCGRLPFTGSREQLEDQILNGTPRFPKLRPAIQPDLAAIALKCIEKEPARRYGTAAELADDIGRWLNNDPVTARPPSLARRATLWVKRKPLVASLSLMISVMVLALIGGSATANVMLTRAYGKQAETVAYLDEAARELAATLNNLAVRELKLATASTLVDNSTLDSARTSQSAAIDIFSRLIRRGAKPLRHELAVGYYNMGLIEQAVAPTKSIDWYVRAIACWEDLATEQSSRLHSRWLTRAYNNLGTARQTNNRALALIAYRSAIEASEGIGDLSDCGSTLELASAYRNLAYCLPLVENLAAEENGPVLEEIINASSHAIMLIERAAVPSNDPAARDLLRDSLSIRVNVTSLMAVRDQRPTDFDMLVNDLTQLIELDDEEERYGHRLKRAWAYAESGQYTMAISEADDLRVTAVGSGSASFNLACVYSIASGFAARDSHLTTDERHQLVEHYQHSAIQLLRSPAASALLRQDSRFSLDDPDLAPLTSRSDFKELADDLRRSCG